jgi:glycosyltransferase involved in cell wall biosynthesis
MARAFAAQAGERMRIWFAAQVPASSRGGVARSMRELSAGLRTHGHDTRVICAGKLTKGNYLLFALSLLVRFACAWRNRPDWLIARSTDGVLVALVCRLFGLRCRVMLHNHGWEELVYAQERLLPRSIVTSPTTWKARFVRFPLLRLALHVSHGCMSGTLHEARWLRGRYPACRAQCVCVPNGVAAKAGAHWVGQKQIPPYFLSVGGFTWKKNIEHTVAVFAHLQAGLADARLVCVGTGISGAIPALAEKCNAQDAIVNAGDQPFEAMDGWYDRCPFVLLSSRYEGGRPFTLLEAMSHGAVVFASAIPSHREIVHDGMNGFLISGTDAVQDALLIQRVLNDTTGSAAIRLKAAHFAQRNRWDRQVRRLERIL